ncbi:hypothetical protein FB554_2247 [Barrientosiimonas humi]|uniref:Uncharacterized protein n=1 Tax=Barrientosiimonas humi TaxID=999931 RepID=A0A542XE30_9MICO|nr:hypothetical protein FB554_2247 [Barrientosiimonas humi]CAG7574078.1 hypothetical protein BH39T_PBIAJDOK_02721 [Barrientosiimonas humi]
MGQLIAALTFGTVAQFCTAPFAQVLNLTGHSLKLLGWDSLRILSAVASLCIPGILGASLVQTMLSYSLALSLVYLVLCALVLRAVQDPQTTQEEKIA